ncbi:MAG TPA: uroporphyrinogen-III synthase [Methyloceanibacter sp.]|jgi:uroporphyrinogen-III synthase|nr:uroporphyrinogen-III synthase [Methyloceanibacter sp.]
MRILVTRPGPDAEREAERLAALGHEPVVGSLLVIEFAGDVPLQLDGAQALIATSRNALHALAAHPELDAALALPLLAVGEGTARQAQLLGFADVTIGPGTAAELAALILEELKPERGPLVHLAGETLAVDLKGALEKQGFAMRAPALYRATPVRELPAEAARLLSSGELDGVILMSPRTARTFAALVAAASVVTQGRRPVCYCLSEAVADAVSPLGFATRVAARPREEDVLALLDSEAASS